jgi:hypothetical protein
MKYQILLVLGILAVLTVSGCTQNTGEIVSINQTAYIERICSYARVFIEKATYDPMQGIVKLTILYEGKNPMNFGATLSYEHNNTFAKFDEFPAIIERVPPATMYTVIITGVKKDLERISVYSKDCPNDVYYYTRENQILNTNMSKSSDYCSNLRIPTAYLRGAAYYSGGSLEALIGDVGNEPLTIKFTLKYKDSDKTVLYPLGVQIPYNEPFVLKGINQTLERLTISSVECPNAMDYLNYYNIVNLH